MDNTKFLGGCVLAAVILSADRTARPHKSAISSSNRPPCLTYVFDAWTGKLIINN